MKSTAQVLGAHDLAAACEAVELRAAAGVVEAVAAAGAMHRYERLVEAFRRAAAGG
jgi:uncharacterized protein with GYD domain